MNILTGCNRPEADVSDLAAGGKSRITFLVRSSVLVEIDGGIPIDFSGVTDN